MTTKINRFALVSAVQLADVIYLANGVDNVKMTDGLLSGGVVYNMGTTAPAKGSFAASAGAAGDPTGDLEYVVTFIRAAGSTYPAMESGECDPASVTVASERVVLADIPVSADSQVTGRKIYRRGNTLVEWYLVTTIADNTTTDYTDNATDASLRGNDILRPARSTYPYRRTNSEGLPPKVEYMAVWENRIWGVLEDELSWSEPKPWQEDWPSKNNDPIAIRGGIGERATGLIAHNGELYVFTEDQIFVVERSELGFRAVLVNHRRGSPGGHAIISVGNYLYWLDRQAGPVRWSGASDDPEPVGWPLRDEWDEVEKNALHRAWGEFKPSSHQIWWHYTKGRYDRNNRRLVLDVLSGFWYIDHADATAGGLVRNEEGELAVLGGSSFGDIIHMDLGTGDFAGADGTNELTGTLTAAGRSLTDSGAAFDTSGDEIEGAPLYEFDANMRFLQSNTVASVVSGTNLLAQKPLHADIAYYTIGGLPLLWESPWLKADPEGPQLLRVVTVSYGKGDGATIYVDCQGSSDAEDTWTRVGSFTDDGDGREELYSHDLDEFHKIRVFTLAVGSNVEIRGLVASFMPTGGK